MQRGAEFFQSRKNMTRPHPTLSEPLASEITAALIDLEALTRRAACAAHAHLEAMYDEVLERVLALCKAQRGAVLLSEGHDSSPMNGDSAQPTSDHAKTVRTLALHDIHEEDAHALLRVVPPAHVHFHSAEMICWISYGLSLNEVTGESGGALDVPSGASSHVEEGRNALLVLGWSNESDEACASMIERCQTLLPLVADAIGAVVACLAMKERVQELERNSVRESLQDMELLKAELLGTVSHELRSPLASIKGYAATLLRHERRLGREERHQFLLAITEASDRLEVIIERLFEVSQLETGQVRIDRAPVDMARLVGEAIAAIEGRVEALFPGRFVFGPRLKRADDAPADVVPLIEADQRRLREVLDNLLENAVNYSPGGGAIDVAIRPVVQIRPVTKGTAPLQDGENPPGGHVPRRMLEICVSDSGQGIPDGHLQRIFERFHRVDTRLTRETNGLGLGLTICKRIVELHDGLIWAENRPHSGGAAFYVRLPIDEPPG
jgi:signal transduction histidine kinase